MAATSGTHKKAPVQNLMGPARRQPSVTLAAKLDGPHFRGRTDTCGHRRRALNLVKHDQKPGAASLWPPTLILLTAID